MAGDLDAVAKVVAATYRMLGVTTADPSLVLNGEAADDVMYQLLTRGCRIAQRFMLDEGFVSWRSQSSALTWTGTDDANGGRYASTPTGFIRAYSSRDDYGTRTAMVEANGDRWGTEIHPDQRHIRGNHYYLWDTDGTEQIWLTRSAAPPTTLYMNYFKQHDAWSSGVTVTFPLECRHLIVSEAAALGMDESWFPGDAAMKQAIMDELQRDHEHVKDFCRRTKRPRALRRPNRFGNF